MSDPRVLMERDDATGIARLTINNPDGDQQLSGIHEMHLPPGNAALIASVTPCEEPLVARNEC